MARELFSLLAGSSQKEADKVVTGFVDGKGFAVKYADGRRTLKMSYKL